MGLTGLVLFDVYPEMLSWINNSVKGYDRAFSMSPHDGTSIEGYGYLLYSLETLLAFADSARRMLDIDYFTEEWLKAMPDYLLHMTLPKNNWDTGSHADIADSDRDNLTYIGPDFILRKLASEYQDGRLQHLAGELDRKNLCNMSSSWYNLIWYDPSVLEEDFSDMPDMKWFDDIDIVSARSGWDGDESVLFYKNGPYIGHKAYRLRKELESPLDWGSGHVHPDANSFSLFGNGDWLLRDDGYSPKYTANHNTLLMDGLGQAGEGSTWLDHTKADNAQGESVIYNAYSTANFAYMAGEGAGAYTAGSGLTKYTRQILLIKPSALIVIDKIETNAPKNIELRFFPEGGLASSSGGSLTFEGNKNRLKASQLYGGSTFGVENVTVIVSRNATTELREAIRVTKEVDGSWTNITAFAWSEAARTPVLPSMSGSGNILTFTHNGKSVTVDTEKLAAYTQTVNPKAVYVQYKANGLNTDTKRMKAGDSITAGTYILSPDPSPFNSVLILAVYDTNNRLVDISLSPYNIPSADYGGGIETEPIILSSNFDEYYKVNAYVWDFQSLKPLK